MEIIFIWDRFKYTPNNKPEKLTTFGENLQQGNITRETGCFYNYRRQGKKHLK